MKQIIHVRNDLLLLILPLAMQGSKKVTLCGLMIQYVLCMKCHCPRSMLVAFALDSQFTASF